MRFLNLVFLTVLLASRIAGAQLVPTGQADVHPDTIFFGGVVVGAAKTLPATVTSSGPTSFQIASYSIANSLDFSASGNTAVTLTPGAVENYGVTFSPGMKTGLVHVGYLTFTFDDGQPPKTVVLIGYDHTAITGKSRIGRNYWAYPNSNVTVSQELLTSMDSAADSIRHFTETISFNPSWLDLVSVDRGALMSTDWNLASTSLSLGSVQIVANSAGTALHGPGELLTLTFHVHSEAPFWDTSSFPQTNMIFGNGSEPIMSSEPGLLRIRNSCTPTFLQSGAAGTGIILHSGSVLSRQGQIEYGIGEDVPAGARATLRMYNALGEIVAAPVDGAAVRGEHRVEIQQAGLTTGLYTLELCAGGVRDVRRVFITP